jgi:hypothetical protein
MPTWRAGAAGAYRGKFFLQGPAGPLTDFRRSFVPAVACGALLPGVLAGCTGGSSQPGLSATSSAVRGSEDREIDGRLTGKGAGTTQLKFVVVGDPAHGQITVDPATGAFSYVPDADFNGRDRVEFVVEQDGQRSRPAFLDVDVSPVNDPPTLALPPAATNSADASVTAIAFAASDVDGDVLKYDVRSTDAGVAQIQVDADASVLRVTPLARGRTTITVEASDGLLTASSSIEFNVTDVTKHRSWSLANPKSKAIHIVNRSTGPVAFAWTHDGNRVLTGIDAVMEDVERSQSSRSGLAAERVWYYLIENVYHWYSLTESSWVHDPVALVNSVGFGLCDDVANAAAELGRHAGLSTRVWWLSGHVVPETYDGKRWRMYDPDLVVYYKDAMGEVQGVEDLAANPEYITNPIEPVRHDSDTSNAYWQEVADIYSTTDDNRTQELGFVSGPGLSGDVSLPPGASLTYPGRWAPAPIGVEGEVRVAVPAYAQARLDLPTGYSGPVAMPLVLWAVTGAGRVNIDGTDYDVPSTALDERLRSVAELPKDVQVTATGPMSLVYLVNPLRFAMTDKTVLDLTSLDAWALEVSLLDLPLAERPQLDELSSLRKTL